MFSKWFHPDNIYPLHYTLYTMTGFWKIESKSRWKKLLYDFYHIAIELCFIFTFFALAFEAYLVRNNVAKLSSNLCVTICLFGSLSKIWILYSKRKESDMIRAKLDNNLNLPNIGRCISDQEIFERNSRELAKITVVLYGLSIPLVTFWIFFPMIDNAKERKHPVRWPPIPGIMESPGFEVMYVYISLELILFCANIMSYDLIFYGYLIRICAHFEILDKNLRKINDLYPKINFGRMIKDYRENGGENDFFEHNYKLESIIRANNVYGLESSGRNGLDSMSRNEITKKWRCQQTERMIKVNVIHHKAILKAIEDIGRIYQGPIMFHVTCGAAMVGVLAYGIIAESESLNSELLQRFLFVSGTLIDLFIYCYYGTQIAQRNFQVGETLYDSPWYEMETAPRKLIGFMMAKLQKPTQITASKVFPINLRTYLKLLKVAYDMIAILRETRKHGQDY